MPRLSAADGACSSLEARLSDLIFSRLRRVKPGLLLRALQASLLLVRQVRLPPAGTFFLCCIILFPPLGNPALYPRPHSCLEGGSEGGRERPGSLRGSILLSAHLPEIAKPL